MFVTYVSLDYLLEQLMTLIGAAKEHGIEFIYAISPGLDITFSNQKEVSALKRKLDQVFTCLYIPKRLLSQIHVKFVFLCFYNVTFRLPILAASHLPYFLMTSTTICALLTKRCSAHSHTLRFLSPTKSSSTLESQKPSSSVPQVPTCITSTCIPNFTICY